MSYQCDKIPVLRVYRYFSVMQTSKTRFIRSGSFVPVLCLVSVSTDAFAYLDPATGSIILQGILAALAGVMLTARIYWEKIKSFFRRDEKASSKKDE